MQNHLSKLLTTAKSAWWSAQSHQIVRRLHGPLRRSLEKHDALDLLLSVYAYIQFLQFDVELPAFLHYAALDEKPPRETGLTEWELDLLSREAIAYAKEIGGRRVRSYLDVAHIVNLVKRLEENIWRAYPYGQRDIIREFNRQSHRQFPWQRPTNHPAIGRYFKVYSAPDVENVLRRVTGIGAVDLFRIGIGLTGHFLERPVLPIPMPSELGVDSPHLDTFLKRFATTFDELRSSIRAKNSFGVNWAYVPNPLRDTPLIVGQLDSGHNYFCPIPSFLLQRLTSGIYYELIDDEKFANPFGASFQSYIGEVLDRANLDARPYKIYAERKYGPRSQRKDTVDWIIEDPTANLFVEVKTKRLAVSAKIDLENQRALDLQMEKMADFVVQIYKTLVDALNGAYPEWQPNGLPIYPVVVTLEEWFPLGSVMHNILESRVRALMIDADMDVAMIDEMPYSIASADDFEMGIYVMARRGVQAVMADRTSKEKREWLLAAVLSNSFADDLVGAGLFFPEIWDELVPGSSERIGRS